MRTDLPEKWLDHVVDIRWSADDKSAACSFEDDGLPSGTFTLEALCQDYPHLPQAIRVARYVYSSDEDQLAALQHWSSFLQQPMGAPPLLGSSAIAKEHQDTWFDDWSAVEQVPGRTAAMLTITQPFEAGKSIFEVQVPWELLTANFPWATESLALYTAVASNPQEAASILKLDILNGPQEIDPMPLPEDTGSFSYS